MASMLDGMFQSILSNVPGSPQNQAKQQSQLTAENTALINQSMAFKATQDRLAADANAQLAPLKLEADKAKYQEDIGKAQLSVFMQPWQKKQLESQMADSVTTGSDPKTGATGQVALDAQIAKINNQAQMAATLDMKNAGHIYAQASSATSELRRAGEKARDEATNTLIQQVATNPIDSTLKQADLQPDNTQLQFVKQYKAQNPDATNAQIASQLSRVFGMDAKERETLNSRESHYGVEHNQWIEDDKRRKEQFAQTERLRRDNMAQADRIHGENLNARATAQDNVLYQRQQEQAAKADKQSDDTVSKLLKDYTTFNSDTKPRGTAATLNAARVIESVTNGQPVNKDSILHAISRESGPDAAVDTKQIQALTVMQAELSKFYGGAGGPKSTKEILGSEYTAGAFPRIGSKVDAWLLGGGNPMLADKEQRTAFAGVISDLYKNMTTQVAAGQIGKSNIGLTDPRVTPDHKLRLAQNVMESPSSLPATKLNTGIKLMEDLRRMGVKPLPDDEPILKTAISKLKNPTNKSDLSIASSVILRMYSKYAKMGNAQSTAPQQNKVLPVNSESGVPAIVPPIMGLK